MRARGWEPSTKHRAECVGATPWSWTQSSQVRQTSAGSSQMVFVSAPSQEPRNGAGRSTDTGAGGCFGQEAGIAVRSSGDWRGIICIIWSMFFKCFLVRLCHGPKARAPQNSHADPLLCGRGGFGGVIGQRVELLNGFVSIGRAGFRSGASTTCARRRRWESETREGSRLHSARLAPWSQTPSLQNCE